MKKHHFALFLIIILLISSCAVAETVDESFYVGTWICFFHLENGGFSYFLFDLAEDHTAYISIHSVSPDLTSSGRDNIKTWSADGNDLHVVTGNTVWDLFVTSDYRLAEEIPGGYYVFEKVGGAGKDV